MSHVVLNIIFCMSVQLLTEAILIEFPRAPSCSLFLSMWCPDLVLGMQYSLLFLLDY